MSTVFPWLADSEALRPVRARWPVFRQECGEYAMFYAPGCLCVVDVAAAERFQSTIVLSEARWEPGSGAWPERSRTVDWGGELWRRAELAIAEARRWQEEPFSPECLTLYMNNECNLDCVYCHSDPSPAPAARLELAAIAAAAEVVADNCRRKGRPLYAVFHGGGEPTLHRRRVERALALLDRVASARGVELFRYVATNGVMPEEKALWLARRFDLIGLSCDGPADIQNSQRPRWGGGGTSHIVERTGHILRQEGCRLHVRTTITSATLRRQAEIAAYICQQFSPEEIHFEPLYIGGKTSATDGLLAHQAHDFVVHFLEARQIAREHGILLMTSGSRPGSIHGPYCHVFRSVLNLVPGGVATACFKVTDATQAKDKEKGVAIGALNSATGRFEIDLSRVQELRRRLDVIPAHCADCFNRYHCVRECPDQCPLESDDLCDRSSTPEPGFRCQMQKALTYATLRETAEALWSVAVEKRGEEDGANVYGTTIL
ncbi:MAG: radical SAM protein [Anaerolineales bacterium]|nr:radical SAM protein [Anaerolineales bacterium]